MSNNINELLQFIKEETNKIHKIITLEEEKIKIDKQLNEILDFASKKKKLAVLKRKISEIMDDVRDLKEDDVILFYDSFNDKAQSIKTVLENINVLIPELYDLAPELFYSLQNGITITVNDDIAIVPERFKELLSNEDGVYTISLYSIKKGISNILLNKFKNIESAI